MPTKSILVSAKTFRQAARMAWSAKDPWSDTEREFLRKIFVHDSPTENDYVSVDSGKIPFEGKIFSFTSTPQGVEISLAGEKGD